MAVYQAEAFLVKALESVCRQTMQEWQLICVDDASTDRSWDLLSDYAKRDSRIVCIHKDRNEGQAIARNEALKRAEGDFITMLDADDWLSDNCLEKALEVLTDDTDCAVLQLMQVYEGGSTTSHVHRREAHEGASQSNIEGASQEHLDGASFEELYEVPFDKNGCLTGYEAFVASLDWSLHGLYVVRRDIHLRYPYDTSCKLYSDDNTTRLHYLHSRKVRMCEGIYYYRKHDESCTNALTPSRFLLMEANVSMRNALLQEPGLGQDVLDYYEKHRWLNYIGQMWQYSQCKHRFTADDRRVIEDRFAHVYTTFSKRPVPIKFGFTWLPPCTCLSRTCLSSYSLFLLQERLYFCLKRIKEGL